MGMIQSAVNQALGTIGLAARLSPDYETKQELHKLNKEEKATNLQSEQLNVTPEEFEKNETIGARQAHEILQKQAEIAQRQFELKPSKKSLKKATFARSAAGEGPVMTFGADPDEIAMEQMEQANASAQIKKDVKAEQSNQVSEFQKRFLEDVNTMKGVRSVTTFGADTGSPYLRSRTIYTPGREEVK